MINADRAVTYGTLVRLSLLARNTGFTNVLLATRPVDTVKRVQLP